MAVVGTREVDLAITLRLLSKHISGSFNSVEINTLSLPNQQKNTKVVGAMHLGKRASKCITTNQI